MTRPVPAKPRRRFALLARFARAHDGATAVEFSLITLPLMLLVFGVLELGMVFLASTTLQTATEIAARRIRTGAFQEGGANTKDDFQAMVCNAMGWLSSGCASNLYVDVRTFANFGDLAGSPTQQASTFNAASTCWSPGQPGDIVLVRVYYRWKLFTPGLNAALENMGGGMRLLSTATAFRNEPYNDNLPAGAAC